MARSKQSRDHSNSDDIMRGRFSAAEQKSLTRLYSDRGVAHDGWQQRGSSVKVRLASKTPAILDDPRRQTGQLIVDQLASLIEYYKVFNTRYLSAPMKVEVEKWFDQGSALYEEIMRQRTESGLQDGVESDTKS